MHVNVRRWAGLCVVHVLGIASLAAAAEDVQLAEAAKRRDNAAVRALLQQRVDVNAPLRDGATALHWAAHWDDLETTELLIQAGATVNATNDLGVTPLALACTNGNAVIIERLLTAGANVQAPLSTGETALMRAVRTGKIDAVKVLLAHGADVNGKEPLQEQTALMWAVALGHQDIARILIASGADVQARSKSAFTPLLFATREGNLEGARMVVAAGADVNETAADGSSALLVATVRGHAEIAHFLLEKGADPNADAAGYAPLHWTMFTMESELTGLFRIMAQTGEWSKLGGLEGTAKLALLQALLARGANVNARMTKELPQFGYSSSGLPGELRLAGGTAFMLAAKSGDVEAMRFLLAHGADPHVPTTEKTTPLMIAAGYGRVLGQSRLPESRALETTKLMLELGGDVNAKNEIGETALHGAAYQGWNSIVQLLVEKGAEVNPKNARGETPLFIAAGNVYHSGGYTAHPQTAELIRKLGGIIPEGLKPAGQKQQ